MSWLDEVEARAKAVKVGQWTSYHVDALADDVLKLVGLQRGEAAPVAPVVEPVIVPVETHVEGADVPPQTN